MSNERERATDADLTGQWERLANELRACKETQRRTWGELDDVTLGRYLAGELSGEEKACVETELLQRPELRQLTDLVRDVLGELEPVESELQPVAEPQFLSFEKARAKRRPILSWVRQRSSLVAAACLMLILGVAMPNPGLMTAPSEVVGLAVEPALADRVMARGGLPEFGAIAEPGAPAPVAMTFLNPPRQARSMPKMLRSPSNSNAVSSVSLGSEKAVALSSQRQAALGHRHPPPSRFKPSRPAKRSDGNLEWLVALQREGNDLRKRGDLVAAEDKLAHSYFFCKDAFGEHHQATKNSACSLADVYATGLNAAPSEMLNLKMQQESTAPVESTALAASDSADVKAASLSSSSNGGMALYTRLETQSVRHINQQVVPVLTAAIQSAPSGEKRRFYLQALSQLGPAACTAVPMLTKRLHDCTDAEEVKELKHALKQMAVGCVGIRDEAGCFSFGVLRQSCKQLCELAQESGVEVFVETCPKDRADPAQVLKRMGPRAVVVFIDTKAPSVRIQLSEQLQKDGFDTERLRQQVLASCRDRKFDQGLIRGVQAIQVRAERLKKE